MTDKKPLAPGLYFVATPIGNARDITLRALDVLRDADVLAAEDTRSLRRLMEIHGVPLNGRRVLAYHDHNGSEMRPRLLGLLEEGRSVAYASEAGMPLIADPGYVLGRDAAEMGHAVTSAPGVSASLVALLLSGLPTDAFTFAGFAPSGGGARRKFLEGLADAPGTLILFESPRRLAVFLQDASEVLGAERPAAVCRELTKKFEEARRGTLAELGELYADAPPKGEIVVCIGRGERSVTEDDVRARLEERLKTEKLKTASAQVAEELGVSKRDVYQMGLRIQQGD